MLISPPAGNRIRCWLLIRDPGRQQETDWRAPHPQEVPIPAPLKLPPHLTSEEITQSCPTCAEGAETTHWHITLLLDQGWHVTAVAAELGYTVE